MNLKKASQKQEKKVAKELNANTVIASGSMWGSKGDVRNDEYLIECKMTQRPFYSLTKSVWEKIQKEALKDGMRIPMMCIDLENGKKQFIVMLIDDLPPKAKTAVECDTEGLFEMHPFQISFSIKETKGYYANVVETSWGTFAIMGKQEYLHFMKEV